MKQPDNFGFGEEAALLKDSARKFFTDNFPADRLHGMVATDPTPDRMTPCTWDVELWRQMVELGWSMLAVPESAGGVEMPLVAVAGLVEEVGRAAFPCPLAGTLNATYVLRGCGDSGQGPLEELASGLAATLAITDADGDWRVSQTGVNCVDDRLEGTAWYVQDARKVDRFLVSAHSPEGLALYWVAADAPGVTIAADAIVDLTRDQAHIQFDSVEATRVSSNALAVLEGAMPAIWILLAADIVGAAEWQLQTTVDYVSTRQQFERQLGFFQAVKHPLVDVMVQIDQTKSLVYSGACAVDTEPARAVQDAHMAKASACETAAFASGRSIQSHGGIGFTWECFAHVYFKRQKHSQLLWGDAAWHRRRLADIVIGEVA